MPQKSSVKSSKASAAKNMSRDSDLSDSSGEEDAFQATQAPPKKQMSKVAAASSESDLSSDDAHDPPPPARKSTGKPQLLGISPILAKLSKKDTSTPLKVSKKVTTPLRESKKVATPLKESKKVATPLRESKKVATPLKVSKKVTTPLKGSKKVATPLKESKKVTTPVRGSKKATPLKPTQQMSGSDSDSDKSEDSTHATQGRLKATQARSGNTSKSPHRESQGSDSEYDAPWNTANKIAAPQEEKVSNASDSSDLDSDNDEAEEPVPVRTKPQSPIKAKVAEASDSSNLDSDDDEAEKPAPVRTKSRSPLKADVSKSSDSSDLDSDDEAEIPVPVRTKPQSPKKGVAQTQQNSDSDMDSDDEESVQPPAWTALSKPLSKSIEPQNSSESDSELSSDDNNARTSFQREPKPASPAKATFTPTAMEVDESSDDEAMLREAMKKVDEAEERARAGALLRKNTQIVTDSDTDDELPKSAKSKQSKQRGSLTKATTKTPTRTPKKPEVKEADSFLSKEIISDSDGLVSSDSEPEKLGSIRLMNKSITSIVKKEVVPVEAELPSSSEEEDQQVVDDSPGLLYLEDLGSDDEVWVVRCPVNVKHSNLIGQKLKLGGISKFTVGDAQFVSRTYQHGDDHSRLSCMLRSKNVDGLLKVVSMPTAGQVTFTRRMKQRPVVLPPTTCMEGKTTSLPSGLKTRHPLFGADFEHSITERDKTEDRPQKKVTSKSPKKEAKRRSVTFRENPSFERSADQESSSNENEITEKVKKLGEDSGEGPETDDLVARKVKKSPLEKQSSSRKRVSAKLKTPVKATESSDAEVESMTPTDDQEKISKDASSSKKKSRKADKSLSASLLESVINKNTSSSADTSIEPTKNVVESLSDSSISKTQRKSLKLTPIAAKKKVASVLNSSDSSALLPKTTQAKEAKTKDSSKISKLSSFLLDNSIQKDVPKGKSPSTKAKKVTTTCDGTDSSASDSMTSHAKKPNKKKVSKKDSPSKSKKSASKVNDSDSPVAEPESTHVQVSSEKDNSHAESPSSKTKEKSVISSSFDSNAVLAEFLNKSKSFRTLDSFTGKLPDSHSDSPSTKLKAKSLKSPGLTLTNGSDILKGDISIEKDGKTNKVDIITTPDSKKKVAKKATTSKRVTSAKSLSTTSKSPRTKKEKVLVEDSLKNKADSTGDSAPIQRDLLADLMRKVISSTEKGEKGSLNRSRKSSGGDGTAVKKERVAIVAKRRITKPSAEDASVSQGDKKVKKALTPNSKSKSAIDEKQMLAEQKIVVDELMRQCLGKQKKEAAKKRPRDASEEGVVGEKAVKKSRKGKLADDQPDTPTSSKLSGTGKLPLKKYRQLTLTATIPPGIAELSPGSAKRGSKKSSLKIEDSSPMVGDTTPSKQKKKRKHDSSISDLEIGSKTPKPTAQTEMGSQDASFTSKFQEAGYAGPDTPPPPSSSLGASQSDIDVRFESQDSIGLVANLDTNQFELPKPKKARKSHTSKDKLKLDASIDFEDFGSGANLVSSTQKQSPKVLPSARSSQSSDVSEGSQKHSRKAVPSEVSQDSPFVFKAPSLSKGKRSKSISRAEESGFESDGSSSRRRGEIDGFESDVTLKLFRTQPDPIMLAKQKAKKHHKSAC